MLSQSNALRKDVTIPLSQIKPLCIQKHHSVAQGSDSHCQNLDNHQQRSFLQDSTYENNKRASLISISGLEDEQTTLWDQILENMEIKNPARLYANNSPSSNNCIDTNDDKDVQQNFVKYFEKFSNTITDLVTKQQHDKTEENSNYRQENETTESNVAHRNRSSVIFENARKSFLQAIEVEELSEDDNNQLSGITYSSNLEDINRRLSNVENIIQAFTGHEFSRTKLTQRSLTQLNSDCLEAIAFIKSNGQKQSLETGTMPVNNLGLDKKTKRCIKSELRSIHRDIQHELSAPRAVKTQKSRVNDDINRELQESKVDESKSTKDNMQKQNSLTPKAIGSEIKENESLEKMQSNQHGRQESLSDYNNRNFDTQYTLKLSQNDSNVKENKLKNPNKLSELNVINPENASDMSTKPNYDSETYSRYDPRNTEPIPERPRSMVHAPTLSEKGMIGESFNKRRSWVGENILIGTPNNDRKHRSSLSSQYNSPSTLPVPNDTPNNEALMDSPFSDQISEATEHLASPFTPITPMTPSSNRFSKFRAPVYSVPVTPITEIYPNLTPTRTCDPRVINSVIKQMEKEEAEKIAEEQQYTPATKRDKKSQEEGNSDEYELPDYLTKINTEGQLSDLQSGAESKSSIVSVSNVSSGSEIFLDNKNLFFASSRSLNFPFETTYRNSIQVSKHRKAYSENTVQFASPLVYSIDDKAKNLSAAPKNKLETLSTGSEESIDDRIELLEEQLYKKYKQLANKRTTRNASVENKVNTTDTFIDEDIQVGSSDQISLIQSENEAEQDSKIAIESVDVNSDTPTQFNYSIPKVLIDSIDPKTQEPEYLSSSKLSQSDQFLNQPNDQSQHLKQPKTDTDTTKPDVVKDDNQLQSKTEEFGQQGPVLVSRLQSQRKKQSSNNPQQSSPKFLNIQPTPHLVIRRKPLPSPLYPGTPDIRIEPGPIWISSSESSITSEGHNTEVLQLVKNEPEVQEDEEVYHDNVFNQELEQDNVVANQDLVEDSWSDETSKRISIESDNEIKQNTIDDTRFNNNANSASSIDNSPKTETSNQELFHTQRINLEIQRQQNAIEQEILHRQIQENTLTENVEFEIANMHKLSQTFASLHSSQLKQLQEEMATQGDFRPQQPQQLYQEQLTLPMGQKQSNNIEQREIEFVRRMNAAKMTGERIVVSLLDPWERDFYNQNAERLGLNQEPEYIDTGRADQYGYNSGLINDFDDTSGQIDISCAGQYDNNVLTNDFHDGSGQIDISCADQYGDKNLLDDFVSAPESLKLEEMSKNVEPSVSLASPNSHSASIGKGILAPFISSHTRPKFKKLSRRKTDKFSSNRYSRMQYPSVEKHKNSNLRLFKGKKPLSKLGLAAQPPSQQKQIHQKVGGALRYWGMSVKKYNRMPFVRSQSKRNLNLGTNGNSAKQKHISDLSIPLSARRNSEGSIFELYTTILERNSKDLSDAFVYLNIDYTSSEDSETWISDQERNRSQKNGQGPRKKVNHKGKRLTIDEKLVRKTMYFKQKTLEHLKEIEKMESLLKNEQNLKNIYEQPENETQDKLSNTFSESNNGLKNQKHQSFQDKAEAQQPEFEYENSVCGIKSIELEDPKLGHRAQYHQSSGINNYQEFVSAAKVSSKKNNQDVFEESVGNENNEALDFLQIRNSPQSKYNTFDRQTETNEQYSLNQQRENYNGFTNQEENSLSLGGSAEIKYKPSYNELGKGFGIVFQLTHTSSLTDMETDSDLSTENSELETESNSNFEFQQKIHHHGQNIGFQKSSIEASRARETRRRRLRDIEARRIKFMGGNRILKPIPLEAGFGVYNVSRRQSIPLPISRKISRLSAYGNDDKMEHNSAKLYKILKKKSILFLRLSQTPGKITKNKYKYPYSKSLHYMADPTINITRNQLLKDGVMDLNKAQFLFSQQELLENASLIFKSSTRRPRSSTVIDFGRIFGKKTSNESPEDNGKNPPTQFWDKHKDILNPFQKHSNNNQGEKPVENDQLYRNNSNIPSDSQPSLERNNSENDPEFAVGSFHDGNSKTALMMNDLDDKDEDTSFERQRVVPLPSTQLEDCSHYYYGQDNDDDDDNDDEDSNGNGSGKLAPKALLLLYVRRLKTIFKCILLQANAHLRQLQNKNKIVIAKTKKKAFRRMNQFRRRPSVLNNVSFKKYVNQQNDNEDYEYYPYYERHEQFLKTQNPVPEQTNEQNQGNNDILENPDFRMYYDSNNPEGYPNFQNFQTGQYPNTYPEQHEINEGIQTQEETDQQDIYDMEYYSQDHHQGDFDQNSEVVNVNINPQQHTEMYGYI